MKYISRMCVLTLVTALFLAGSFGVQAKPASKTSVVSAKVVIVILARVELPHERSKFNAYSSYGYGVYDDALRQLKDEPRVAGYVMLVDAKRARWALVKGRNSSGTVTTSPRTAGCWATKAVQAIEAQLPEDANRKYLFLQESWTSWMEEGPDKALLDSCRVEMKRSDYPLGFNVNANWLFPSAPVVNDMLLEEVRSHLALHDDR